MSKLLCLSICLNIAGASAISIATTAEPSVAGPITGGSQGHPFVADPVAEGYLEAEYFMSGTATRYARAGEWTADGRWDVTPDGTDEYTVRLWVRRPEDPTRFNGVVLVEWLNVTAQREIPGDYLLMREEIIRSGYAWVGVGAQVAGIHAPETGLKAWDPERYAPLNLTSDAFSYDIFSQAGRVLRNPGDVDPLAGLRPATLLATGRSQAAYRLVTYVNAVHPLHRVYDGIFLHSRGQTGAGLTTTGLTEAASEPMPEGANIRLDTDIPVFDLQAEGDLVVLRSHLARQPDSDHYRRWEIAGSAHVQTPRWVATPPMDMGFGCAEPVNTATHHAFVKAGLNAFTRWVRDGTMPPQPADIELADPAADDPIARDEYGNAIGGVRIPQVDVPTATLDGRRNEPAENGGPMAMFCFLYGTASTFDSVKLARLYPTHEAFVSQYNACVDRLLAAGYLLAPEAEEARAAAAASDIGARKRS